MSRSPVGKVSPETRERLSAAKRGALNPMYGKRAPNYAGGRTVHPDGYVMVLAPGRPFQRGRYVMEHRLVIEAHLRETDPSSPFLVEVDGTLYLRPEVEVHHKDGVKDNNDLANLEPLLTADHARVHLAARSQARWALPVRQRAPMSDVQRFLLARLLVKPAGVTALARDWFGPDVIKPQRESVARSLRGLRRREFVTRSEDYHGTWSITQAGLEALADS